MNAETVLLDRVFPRTLDAMVAEFSDASWRGGRVEGWVFEDEAARRAAELVLEGHGVAARFRSAYKPLLHGFLEEFGMRPATIGLPAHALASEQRFRLEAYPLAGLLGGVTFRDTGGELTYSVATDRSTWEVFAPNRVGVDHLEQRTLSPCGWIRAWRPGGAAPARDEAVETEYEAAFQAVMHAVAGHDWGSATPYMDTLEIAVAIPGIERALAWHDEVVSTREALHEDLYFSLLEFFQRHSGRAPGDRTLQPGQIIPEIVAADGPAHVRVCLAPHRVRPEPAGDAGDLEIIERPLTRGEIATALASLGGESLVHHSVQGRPIPGMHRRGLKPGLAITAGQHANETSGVVGALRAARRLVSESDMEFAVLPQDNPDGYALHHRLRMSNPRHMHHAARYTALGDDLDYRMAEPYHEKAARMDAIARTGARLHVNLHGYPAHEWTRPLTGYLPRGFELWSIPKGFFLIMRHHAGLGNAAEAFARALARRLAEDAGLRAFNASQLEVWRAHAGDLSFPVFDGIPCMIVEHERQATPFQLITEYPDETIYGDAFRLAHTTQMNAVLHAAALVQEGMLDTLVT